MKRQKGDVRFIHSAPTSGALVLLHARKLLEGRHIALLLLLLLLTGRQHAHRSHFTRNIAIHLTPRRSWTRHARRWRSYSEREIIRHRNLSWPLPRARRCASRIDVAVHDLALNDLSLGSRLQLRLRHVRRLRREMSIGVST